MFKIEPFETWPKWARQSFNQIGECEESADDSQFFDNAGEWVEKAQVLFIKTTFPSLLRLRYPVTGCHALGAMIGHQEWIIDNVDEIFPPDEVLEIMIEQFDRWLDSYMKTLTQMQREQVARHIRKSCIAVARLVKAFDRACVLKKEAFEQIRVRSANKALANERLEFWEGYTKAYRKPAIPTPDNMSPREKTLSLILLGWRDVQKMKNRTVLRQTLGNIFDKPDVYNHDFVQGICKDVGLDLKKGPGRDKIG